MAQETRVSPIQLNDTGAKILMDLGDSIQKQKIQDKQLQYEQSKLDAANRKEREKSIHDFTQSSIKTVSELKADPEQTKVLVDHMLEQSALALGGGLSENELRYKINQGIGVLKFSNDTKNAVHDQAVAVLKTNPDVSESALTSKLQTTVYKQDPKTINVSTNDYAQAAIQAPDGWKLFDPSKAQATTLKILTDNKDKQTYSSETGGQVGLVRTVKGDKVSFDPTFYELDGKGGVKMLTNEHGLLADKPYQELTTNVSANAYLSHRAQQFIDHYNSAGAEEREKWMKANGITEDELLNAGKATKTLDPNNPEVFETLKRAFATDAVQRHSPISVNGKDVSTIVTTNNYGNPNGYVPPTDPGFTAPVDRAKAITNLDKRFLGEKTKSGNGYDIYDVTSQFKNLPIYTNMATKKAFGPVEVKYNVGGPGQEPTFLVRKKPGKPFDTYTVQQFADLLVPKTEGTGYDPKPKINKGNPR